MSRIDSARPDPLYDTPALSTRLSSGSEAGPSPRTIERWRTTGSGPAFIKIGHRVLYRESAVKHWLDKQTRFHTNDTRERR
jgi:hypothetical protein